MKMCSTIRSVFAKSHQQYGDLFLSLSRHLNVAILSWKQPNSISHHRLMWVWNKKFSFEKPVKFEYSHSIIWVLAGTLLMFRRKALLNITCNFSNHQFWGEFASRLKQNIFWENEVIFLHSSIFLTREANTIL